MVCVCCVLYVVSQGEHPSYLGNNDPTQLGLAERYFLAVADVPWLEQRLSAMAYMKGFDATAAKIKVPHCRILVHLTTAGLVKLKGWYFKSYAL